jgi:asparagine synthase (glutamine-hydrolysing)
MSSWQMRNISSLQTPTSKEEYYYRSIFAEHFPSDAAALCVPQEASVVVLK